MRILILTRAPRRGLATWTEEVRKGCEHLGHAVTVRECSEWMPQPTGKSVDKAVSKELKKYVIGYDLVIASGYRTAWACGEGLRSKTPWVGLMYRELPTTNRELIDRLLPAKRLWASSRTLTHDMDAHFLTNASTLIPFRSPLTGPAQDAARKSLGWPEDAAIVLCAPSSQPGPGYQELVDAIPRAEERIGPILLKRYDPNFVNLETQLKAATLVVVPTYSSSFSMFAVEAMSLGAPVLISQGSNPDTAIIDPFISGATFENHDRLGDEVASCLQMPITLDSFGLAGRTRYETMFSLEPGYARLKEALRDLRL
jgi:glycosyltransferase involved in cell wall biosynthesis